MLPILSIIIIAIKVIVAFSALIMIHEFGHFIVAKKNGVWVEEFGLGLPPRIFGKKFGDTLYSLNWLPIGGFVKLHGETSSDEVVYPDKAFTNKSKPVKIAITLAGIFMNFVLAIICFAIVYSFLGIPGKINLTIQNIVPNSPAQIAGIQEKDIVEKIGNYVISSDEDLKNQINKFKGQKVAIELKRNNEVINLEVTPLANPGPDQGALGIVFSDVQETYFPPIWQRPFVGAWYGLKQTFELSKAVVLGLGSSVQSVSQGVAPKGVVGPIGIIGFFIQFAELGLLPLINLVAIVSVNLAIINLIPFPPLDGSRVALIIAEALTKKKLTPKMEERVYLFGFIVLIGLMLLVTRAEIASVIKSGSLSKYVNSVLNQK
ncbi:RIP metalloprotease RseP [soil metagenome]